MFRIGTDTKETSVLIQRRNDLMGYSASIAWNYPLQVFRRYNPEQPAVRTEMLGLEVCDVSRTESMCVVEIIFVTRTKYVTHPKNSMTSVNNTEVAEPRLRELFSAVLNKRHNRMRQCLSRT